MKKQMTLITLLGILFLSPALADTLRNATVAGDQLIADGKTYTIDTSGKKGKELAGKSGTYDVTGKIDNTNMKIMVEGYSVAATYKSKEGGQF